MDQETIFQDYDAFVFHLDNVVYPEKDYLIQVYYLFAQFLEYTDQIPAGPVVEFMKSTYETDGPENLFEKTQMEFALDQKYKYNYDLLHLNARLPLKLLMFQSTLDFMLKAQNMNKTLIVYADKWPEMQLNKIRQIEWNGLEQVIQVYFSEELADDSKTAFEVLTTKLNLPAEKILEVDQVFF